MCVGILIVLGLCYTAGLAMGMLSSCKMKVADVEQAAMPRRVLGTAGLLRRDDVLSG